MSYAIRHGEILLQPVDEIPKGRVSNHTSFIVGHSETGHHHVLESDKTFSVQDVDKAFVYLQLFEPAKLVHKKEVDKHNTLTIPAGKYKVIYKTEYDPFLKIIRQVQD